MTCSRIIINTLVMVTCFLGAPSFAENHMNVPSAQSLTDGIQSFQCEDDKSGSLPVILVKTDGTWRMSGNRTFDEIDEIGNGFQLKSSNNESVLGFLKQVEEGWVMQLFDETGLSVFDCTSMNNFMLSLTSELAPKLAENANELSKNLADVRREIARTSADSNRTVKTLKNTIKALEGTIAQLTQENAELKDENENFLDKILSGGVAEAEAFISATLKSELSERMQLVRKSGLLKASVQVSYCANRLISQPSQFKDECRRVILAELISGSIQ